MRVHSPLLAALLGLAACSQHVSGGEPPPGPEPDHFEKVTLNASPGEPVGLAVLPDGRVLWTSRPGELWLYDPVTATSSVAARFDVYTHDEEGLQGVAVDPSFAENAWVYLYYSPALATPQDDPQTPEVNEGDVALTGSAADWEAFAGVMRLSRFRLDSDALDLGSEQVILEVPVERGVCCHLGGQIDFDADGNLYLSTGDDTNPFNSNGFTPIDERPGRHPALDAQRSAANTNDLRGKLLRIHVEPDGSYSVPEGNLFAAGTAQTRAEIYAMGLRNPYRFAVDRRTNAIYLADYSPDARADNPARGPAGHGKWTVIRAPGNYGWPYCAAASLAYVDYDFASGVSGSAFDCGQSPVNDSPRNTGLRALPPVVEPLLSYGYGPSSLFPELRSGGIGPMAGPAYAYDEQNPSPTKWPSELDGLPLFYEWTRDMVREFHLDADGNLESIGSLLASVVLDNPIDMEFGPDGSLYVLEYGDGYNQANPDARLSRVDFVRSTSAPALER